MQHYREYTKQEDTEMTFVRYYPRTNEQQKPLETWSPAADVVEKDNGYLLEIDLPGFSKSDFSLKVDENVLTITGERKHKTPTDEKLYRFYERPWGVFKREFRLPEHVDAGKINATYENGVLTLEMVKKEEAKPRTIAIS
jgi:HSP20 family protein